MQSTGQRPPPPQCFLLLGLGLGALALNNQTADASVHAGKRTGGKGVLQRVEKQSKGPAVGRGWGEPTQGTPTTRTQGGDDGVGVR